MVGSVPLWSVVVTGRVNQTEYYVDYVFDTLSMALLCIRLFQIKRNWMFSESNGTSCYNSTGIRYLHRTSQLYQFEL